MDHITENVKRNNEAYREDCTNAGLICSKPMTLDHLLAMKNAGGWSSLRRNKSFLNEVYGYSGPCEAALRKSLKPLEEDVLWVTGSYREVVLANSSVQLKAGPKSHKISATKRQRE